MQDVHDAILRQVHHLDVLDGVEREPRQHHHALEREERGGPEANPRWIHDREVRLRVHGSSENEPRPTGLSV